ncbi:hypothetical protein HanPI659440_Chr12g0446621 [Helianthus annuus]|nr:hypothetical protein HanPI659440_Chr12g0446621 [Helianthus annuus]
MTKSTSSSNGATISENQKDKHDLKPEAKYWKKDVITDQQYPENIADMDYTPARKKSPIHN